MNYENDENAVFKNAKKISRAYNIYYNTEKAESKTSKKPQDLFSNREPEIAVNYFLSLFIQDRHFSSSSFNFFMHFS